MPPNQPAPTSADVAAAQAGDRAALERIVRAIQDRVYHLALRTLVDPQEALDATQEILIVVITNLSSFAGNAAFTTWVHRIAVNTLLNTKRRAAAFSFGAFRDDLHDGLDPDAVERPDDAVLLNELRLSCTMALLLCLDLDHRLAYLLGEVFDLDHRDAAAVLDITPANYRKRLSRARARVVAFTSDHCGLANADAKCRCPRRLPAAMALGRVDPDAVTFAAHPGPDYAAVAARARTVERDLRAYVLQRATPRFAPPADLAAQLTAIVDL